MVQRDRQPGEHHRQHGELHGRLGDGDASNQLRAERGVRRGAAGLPIQLQPVAEQRDRSRTPATAVTPLPPGFALLCGNSLLSGFTPGSTCTLTGMPLATGTFTFQVRIDDSVEAQPRLARVHAGRVGVSAFTNAALPDASTGVLYSQQLAVWDNLGAVTWSVESTSTLPAGLSFSSSGVLSGTPTQTGQYSFTLDMLDSSAQAPQVQLLAEGRGAGDHEPGGRFRRSPRSTSRTRATRSRRAAAPARSRGRRRACRPA